MIYTSKSTIDTENIGRKLAEKLDTGGARRAFIAMRGEMGVGKTAFVRGFASYYGISGVKSPTYSIVNEYRKGNTAIFHFDMYRIESDEDLYSIAYDDYLQKDGFCIAEWSENIAEFIPSEAIFVTVSRLDENEEYRKIEISI